MTWREANDAAAELAAIVKRAGASPSAADARKALEALKYVQFQLAYARGGRDAAYILSKHVLLISDAIEGRSKVYAGRTASERFAPAGEGRRRKNPEPDSWDAVFRSAIQEWQSELRELRTHAKAIGVDYSALRFADLDAREASAKLYELRRQKAPPSPAQKQSVIRSVVDSIDLVESALQKFRSGSPASLVRHLEAAIKSGRAIEKRMRNVGRARRKAAKSR